MKLKTKKQAGFTLMEIMLVMVIIGVIMAVVLPRAFRASTDAKYQLLRQGCTELASWANEWAAREVETQPEAATTSTLDDYMETLAEQTTAGTGYRWIARANASNNWQQPLMNVNNRGGAGGTHPHTSVMDIMPQGKVIKNPFNGLSVFSGANLPTGSNFIPGAIACSWFRETAAPRYHYYALLFLGTDATALSDFHAGQGLTLDGLRAGIYINRLLP